MILLIGFAILVLFEFSIFMSIGPITRLNSDYNIDDYSLNQFNSTIINAYDNQEKTPYISTTPFPSLLFKYYIENNGIVPRWSRLHKKIDQKFKQLKNETVYKHN